MKSSLLRRPAAAVVVASLIAGAGWSAETTGAASKAPASSSKSSPPARAGSGKGLLPDPTLLDGSTMPAEKKSEQGMIGDFELPGDENAKSGKIFRFRASPPPGAARSAGVGSKAAAEFRRSAASRAARASAASSPWACRNCPSRARSAARQAAPKVATPRAVRRAAPAIPTPRPMASRSQTLGARLQPGFQSRREAAAGGDRRLRHENQHRRHRQRWCDRRAANWHRYAAG